MAVKTKQYRTMGDFAFATMKEWILDETLEPGQKIDQDKVANMLGVSKMPVRTSLEKLQAQGLVKIIPHRGAVVSELSKSELEEIGLMRQVLESLATREAVEKLDAGDLKRIEETLLVTEKYIREEKWEEYLKANRDFHMRIYEAASRKLLLRTINELWDLYDRYRRLYLSDVERWKSHFGQHREIWASIVRREATEAARLMEEHTAKSRITLMALFEQRDR